MKRMPNLDNATPGYLADELGKAREKKKEYEQLEGFYKSALVARLGDETECEGDEFVAEVTESSRTALSAPLVRASMDQDWIDEHSTTSYFNVVKTKRKAKE